MRKHLFLLATLLLQVATVSVSAQQKPQAGDSISGVVFDDEGPLWMVNVVERDSNYSIVAHSITDIKGNFSFRLVNPENRIQITYVGYETIELPIDRTHYEIKMIRMEQYLDDIITPRAAERIDIPNDSSLMSLPTVDEVLTGMVAGFDILFESGDLAYGPPFDSLMKKMDKKDTLLVPQGDSALVEPKLPPVPVIQ